MKKHRIISLFSGCGGMDLGFLGGFEIFNKNYRKLPYEIVYANEINKQASKTYANNFPHFIDLKDIREVDISSLPEADVVLGGFPCQPFSSAGKKEGLEDARGDLYLQMKKVIDHVQPKMFIAENVDGLRTHKTNQQKTIDVIVKDLSANYDVEYKILKAVNYGVPQARVRIIFIGKRKDLPGTIIFPPTTHTEKKTSKTAQILTIKDAIDDLWGKIDDPSSPSNHTFKDYSKAKFHPGKDHQGNSKEKADKPARTIRAEAHGNQYAHYNSEGTNPRSENMLTWRRLTVRECARLQTFPDSFTFPVSQTEAHRQIGNAVPPVLAWHIGKTVAKTLKDIEFLVKLKAKTEKEGKQ